MATIVKLPSGGYVNLDLMVITRMESSGLMSVGADGATYAWNQKEEAALRAALDLEDARRVAANPSPIFSVPALDMSHDLRIDATRRSASPGLDSGIRLSAVPLSAEALYNAAMRTGVARCLQCCCAYNVCGFWEKSDEERRACADWLPAAIEEGE